MGAGVRGVFSLQSDALQDEGNNDSLFAVGCTASLKIECGCCFFSLQIYIQWRLRGSTPLCVWSVCVCTRAHTHT